MMMTEAIVLTMTVLLRKIEVTITDTTTKYANRQHSRHHHHASITIIITNLIDHRHHRTSKSPFTVPGLIQHAGPGWSTQSGLAGSSSPHRPELKLTLETRQPQNLNP